MSIKVELELNDIEAELLQQLLNMGIYGKDAEEVLTRVFDAVLGQLIIDGIVFRKPGH